MRSQIDLALTRDSGTISLISRISCSPPVRLLTTYTLRLSVLRVIREPSRRSI